jgi:hypothetical protein
VRLYSVQPRFVYDQLAAGKVYRPEPRLEAEHWLNDEDGQTAMAYDWLCQQMVSRGIKRPDAERYPVWAWFWWSGPKRAKPDLRTSSLKSWAKESRHVLFSLDVPDDSVLLHDYDAWHWCLNYWYLGRSRFSKEFDRRCEAVGKSYYREKPLQNKALHDELVQSWDHIFDLTSVRKVLQHPRKQQVIQATFWELRPNDVVSAQEFGMGQAAVRLPT